VSAAHASAVGNCLLALRGIHLQHAWHLAQLLLLLLLVVLVPSRRMPWLLPYCLSLRCASQNHCTAKPLSSELTAAALQSQLQ
jgi:hypothetical protein